MANCSVPHIVAAGDRAFAKHYPLWSTKNTGEPVYYWAENGMVCYEDFRPKCPVQDRYGAISWQEAARRVLALSEMVAKKTEGGYTSERRMTQQFICDMEKVIREAKEQGDPFGNEERRRERGRRKPKTVVMPRVTRMP